MFDFDPLAWGLAVVDFFATLGLIVAQSGTSLPSFADKAIEQEVEDNKKDASWAVILWFAVIGLSVVAAARSQIVSQWLFSTLLLFSLGGIVVSLAKRFL